jgi:DNA-3-methyladenine glycosylase II
MTRFELLPQGPFDLAKSCDFLCGFTPGAGGSAVREGELRLAFLSDVGFEPLVVSLRQQGRRILGMCERDVDPELLECQVARILSLDHDASGLSAVAERDPVMGRLLAERPGFRPVCFASAYEAALQAVLGQRIPMTLAATLKARLAERTFGVVHGFGERFVTAPPPECLLEVDQVPGIPHEKMRRLHGIAEAARTGRLATERLRRLSRERAFAELQALPGIGPWSAEHVFLRGCGVRDELPTQEPRVLRALSEAYGFEHTASADELCEHSEAWRPYRMWMCVLMVMNLHGSARWHGSEPRGASKPGARVRAPSCAYQA